MNNSEYLNELAARGDGSLQAWFDAEHVESGPINGDGGGTNGIAGGITLPDGDAMNAAAGNGTCPDAMGQSSDAPTLGDLFGILGDEELHEEPDSREKLEADIEKRAVHAETVFGSLRIGIVKVGTNVIYGWLDRQAEITKREWAHVNDMYIADVRAERDAAESRVDELEAEIAKRDKGIARLKRQRDEARDELKNACWEYCETCEHDEQVSRLQRENIQLARDLAECSREREAYRRACGELLDYADQMRLVRLDGCGPALADMDGEVVS